MSLSGWRDVCGGCILLHGDESKPARIRVVCESFRRFFEREPLSDAFARLPRLFLWGVVVIRVPSGACLLEISPSSVEDVEGVAGVKFGCDGVPAVASRPDPIWLASLPV
jgi:hypothetical protein